MKFYANADSKLKIAYIPDWIEFEIEGVNWIFDFQGETDYSDSNINFRFKGDMIPWSIWKNGIEFELGVKDEVSEDFVDSLFDEAKNIVVGFHPARDEDEENVPNDELSGGEGSLYYGNKTYRFKFMCETY